MNAGWIWPRGHQFVTGQTFESEGLGGMAPFP